MKTINPVDAARVELLLADLRLPAIKLMWAKFAEQSDKEGWPAARFLAALAEHEIADRVKVRRLFTSCARRSNSAAAMPFCVDFELWYPRSADRTTIGHTRPVKRRCSTPHQRPDAGECPLPGVDRKPFARSELYRFDAHAVSLAVSEALFAAFEAAASASWRFVISVCS
jgi:hypothetical protein